MDKHKCYTCTNYTGKPYATCQECKKQAKQLASIGRGSKGMRMYNADMYYYGWR